MPLKMINEKEQKSHSSIKHILAIAAGKGGVGKSTITANLAFALQKMGFRVGVMDTDIYGPSIRKLMPEDRLPMQKGEMLIPALSHGMPMISMAYFRREDEASAVRAPIANNIVQQFIQNVAWGDLDFLLVDFPPGTGDVQLTLSQRAQLKGAVMVTTPQELAVMDVKKAMHLFEQVNVPLVGVIENMGYFLHGTDHMFPFGSGGGERLARESGIPFLGTVPLDSHLCSASDVGKSIFKDPDKHLEIVKSFNQIAEQIVEHVELIDIQSKQSLGQFELEWKEVPSS